MRAHAQTVTATLPLGSSPTSVAMNPTTNRMYIASPVDGAVYVIDGSLAVQIADVDESSPVAVAVNPVTNKIYAANTGDNTVKVIDGLTNAVTVSIAVGGNPTALAINLTTNQIYVANEGGQSVTIIDGYTDTIILTLTVGFNPLAVAVNPVTNKIYVANITTNNVSVIDGAATPQHVVATPAVGTGPFAIAVNPVTNLIYAVNEASGTVSVIDGTSNLVTATITVGTNPVAVAINPVTNKIYVTNQGSGTVSVIDGSNNSTASLQVGTGPDGVAVNPTTNEVYVTNFNDSTVSVISGAMGTDNTRIPAIVNATVIVTLNVATNPRAIAVNPVTNQVCAASTNSSNVSIINGITDSTATVAVQSSTQQNRTSIAVNPATNKIYVPNSFVGSSTVSVIDGTTNSTATISTGIGSLPNNVAVNPVTNTIYVTNLGDGTVSVIDGSSDTVTDVVTVGASSQQNGTSIAVNPVTNKIYVTNSFVGSNSVTVIDGVTNATTTITSGIGNIPNNVAINPSTNKIYVTNLGDGTVSVIDGSSDTVTDVVTVGFSTQQNRTSIAVNPATNKIYVPNSFVGSNSVTVIDGVTDLTTTITANIGSIPNNVAVNPITNTIYVTNLGDGTVSVIDGLGNTVTHVVTVGFSGQANGSSIAVNPVTNQIYVPNSFSNTLTVIDGPTLTTRTVTPGSIPNNVAVNLATNNIYVTNLGDITVMAIAEEQVQSIPLTTTIAPLPSNVSTTATPTFTFTASSAFTPNAPSVQNVYFQIDTWEGPWIAASPNCNDFTGTIASPLTQGTHVVYAYATDGQNANSTGLEQQLIGQISAEVFTVILPGTTTALTADNNPAVLGQTVTFTADVTSLSSGTPAGTVTFFDGMSALGPGVLNSGVATLATAALTLGSQSITAVYSGDAGFSGSTSPVLTENIIAPNPLPLPTSLTPTFATVGDLAFTLTVNGSNFVSGSVVQWNGSPLTTLFASAAQLTATVPAFDVLTAGTASVTVFNPTPGGGTSNAALTFTINNPLPGLSSISPTSVTAGSPTFALTLTGSNFVSTSVVLWNNQPLTTAFISSTQLTATVPSNFLTITGSFLVTVSNPVPGGGTSSTFFRITTPVPVLITLAPNSAAAGSSALTVALAGTTFVSNAVAQWNGVALATTFVSSTQLTVIVPAIDLLTAGTASVTVYNAARLPGVRAIQPHGNTPPIPGATSNPLTFTINAPNPAPTLASLSPASTTAGGPAFSLTLTGSNFVTGAVAQWNGIALTTLFVSATQLTATVPATDLLTAGTAAITIFNPTPGGGVSTAVTFTVTATNPAPTLGSLSPTSAAVGDSAFTLTLTGSNFATGAVARWNSVALTTIFVSATQLTGTVPATDLLTAGTAAITVFNPTPGGGVSTAVTFTITATNPTPTLASLSPTSTTAGGPALTVTLAGSNFVTGAVAQWNGVALTTIFVSATQLTATVPSTDLLTAGTAAVTVFNPTPGGGISTAVTFTITAGNPAPTLGSISPTSATAGDFTFMLTLMGSNFVTGAMAQWNGVALATIFVSATQLTATVPGTDLLTAGTAAVTVFNPTPGGGVSTAVTFTITAGNPAPTLVSLSSTSATAQGAAFTLTVTGSNFLANSVAQWNGVALMTTFVSATHVTTVVPAADIQIAGTASITIFNPAPGGGTSSALTFTIVDFVASSPTPPQTVAPGQPALFAIATAPVGGAFVAPVTFTATGLPFGATATFNPPSVTAGSSTTMTITTTPQTVTAFAPKPFGPRGPWFPASFPKRPVALVLGMFMSALGFVGLNKKLRPQLIPLAGLFLLIVTIGFLSSCAGGFPRLPVTSGTPAGTYTITVDGISGTDSHSTTVTLTVE